MNYGQVKDQEIAALEKLITQQRAEIARLEAASPSLGWGASRKADARIEWTKRQLALLVKTLDHMHQPFHAPPTFADADKHLPWMFPTGPSRHEREEVERLRKAVDDPNLPDFTEKCNNLEFCILAIRAYIYQQTRSKLVSEFLKEAQFWDVATLEQEIRNRESERQHTHSFARCLKVFSTDDLVVDRDPADVAGPFLRDLLLELKTLLQQKQGAVSSIDPFVVDIGRKAVQQIAHQMNTTNLRDRLVQKCAELKNVLPVEYHRSLDEFFRRELDKIAKGGPL